MKMIDGVSVEEYAPYWGGDPVYMKPPNEPYDGYYFYNFSSEKQKRTPEWLEQFADAIARTLCRKPLASKDRRGLSKLLRHVKSLQSLARLDDFTRSYATTALWSSTDDNELPLDKHYDITDIHIDTLNQMIADCWRFQTVNADLLKRAYQEYPTKGCSPQEYAGHDLWLTRCGHGAGFFDGDLSKVIGDALTRAADQLGNVDLYAHRGKIYAI